MGQVACDNIEPTWKGHTGHSGSSVLWTVYITGGTQFEQREVNIMIKLPKSSLRPQHTCDSHLQRSLTPLNDVI